MNYRFLKVWLGLLMGPLIVGSLSAMEPLESQQDKLPSLSNSELIQGIKELPKELRRHIVSLLIQHRLGVDFSLAREVNVGSTVYNESITGSPDGKAFYTSSSDKIIRLWDRATGNQLQQFNGDGLVKFSSTGSAILISWQGELNETVILWDIAANQELHRFEHADTIIKVEFSPNGKTFLTMSKDEARLWDAETGCLLNSFYPNNSLVKKLFGSPGQDDFFKTGTYSPDGETIITASHYGEIRFIDVDTGVMVGSFKVKSTHDDYIKNIICSKDGKLLVVQSRYSLFLWDIETAEQRNLSSVPYDSVVLSPDGNTLVTGMVNLFAFRIWDVQSEKPLSNIATHDMCRDLALTPDGKTLFTIGNSDNEIVSIWNKCSKKLNCFSDELKKKGYTIFLDYYPLVASNETASCLSLDCSAQDGHRNDTVLLDSIPEGGHSNDCLIQ